MIFRRDPSFRGWRMFALIAVLALAGFLRGAQRAENGIGHAYYGATVYAMTQSPSNFWYAAAEPGGSMSVDKPPLGFWIQALSASIFGFSDFSLALPQLAAGMLSVVLMHAVIARRFGYGAGIAAALALAVTPVALMLDRTNMPDSLLVLTQLIGLAFGLRAAETGRLRPLLLAMLFFASGFNIKMLQAAFAMSGVTFAYLLAAPVPPRQQFAQLAIAAGVFLVAAFAWPVSVALTPPELRPFVGSTANNDIFELILGYNGAARLTGLSAHAVNPLRVFGGSYFYGAGFFLPLALIALPVIGAGWRPRHRLSEPYLSLLVWGAWLISGVVVVAVAGFSHAYYAVIYAVPAAAIAGIAFAEARKRPRALWILLCAALLVYQLYTPLADGYPLQGLLFCGLALLVAAIFARREWASGLGFAAICIAPLTFSLLTAAMPLDRIVPEPFGGFSTRAWLRDRDTGRLDYNPAALAFLLENTADVDYLLAAPNAIVGAPYALHGRRPVLYITGFTGRDHWIDAGGLSRMVAEGRLRYVYAPDKSENSPSGIRAWALADCTAVDHIDLTPENTGRGGLFDCARP